MNELTLSTDLNVITAEISSYKQVAGQAILEIGKRELGNGATIKQIANHVAPQLGIASKEAIWLMLSVEGGVRSE